MKDCYVQGKRWGEIKVPKRMVNTAFLAVILITLVTTLCLSPAVAQTRSQHRFQQTNLVSDIPGINQRTVDSNLVNSWGIAHSPDGPWFVSDNGTGVATVYDGKGLPFTQGGSPLVITIPASLNPGATNPAPTTGVVFNSTNGFNVTQGNPATFIFVTEDGTIAAWNKDVDLTNAKLKVDNTDFTITGPVYKGVTIGRNGNQNLLYVANFRRGTVDVFDTDFNPVALGAGAFSSTHSGFAPFNVQNIDDRIFVTFAKQDVAKHDDVAGPGNGFVDVFNPDGTLITSLQPGPVMNSPWGVVRVATGFGGFTHHILVGMFGGGNIAAFDERTDGFDSLLMNQFGDPFTIKGLWGLGFGNGALAGPPNVLFFAAGIADESHGLFGTIAPGRGENSPLFLHR